jgi:hypothetical protein
VDYFGHTSFNVTTVTECYAGCPVTICRVTVYDIMTRTTVTVTVTTIHHSSSLMAKADHVRQHRRSASAAPSPGAHGGRDRGRLAQSRGTAHACDGRGVRLRVPSRPAESGFRVPPASRPGPVGLPSSESTRPGCRVHAVPTRATDTAADAA